MDSNMSLADIAAVTGNGEWGGNWVLIILFLLVFSGGFNRGGDFGNYATAASQQEILFGQQFQGLDNKIDRIGNGIADATFSLNNAVVSAANNVGASVTAEGRGIVQNIADLKYDFAKDHAAMKEAIHAEGEATRNMLQQNKIESLQAQVNELKTQNMFCGIPKINPYGYGVYPYQNGCGCNCGNV